MLRALILKCRKVIKINILTLAMNKIFHRENTESIEIIISIIKISSINSNGNSHITTATINKTSMAIINKIINMSQLKTFFSNNKIMNKFSAAIIMLLIIIHTTVI